MIIDHERTKGAMTIEAFSSHAFGKKMRGFASGCAMSQVAFISQSMAGNAMEGKAIPPAMSRNKCRLDALISVSSSASEDMGLGHGSYDARELPIWPYDSFLVDFDSPVKINERLNIHRASFWDNISERGMRVDVEHPLLGFQRKKHALLGCVFEDTQSGRRYYGVFIVSLTESSLWIQRGSSVAVEVRIPGSPRFGNNISFDPAEEMEILKKTWDTVLVVSQALSQKDYEVFEGPSQASLPRNPERGGEADQQPLVIRMGRRVLRTSTGKPKTQTGCGDYSTFSVESWDVRAHFSRRWIKVKNFDLLTEKWEEEGRQVHLLEVDEERSLALVAIEIRPYKKGRKKNDPSCGRREVRME